MSSACGSAFPELGKLVIAGALSDELFVRMEVAGEIVQEIDIIMSAVGVPRFTIAKSRSEMVLCHSTTLL